MTGTGTSLDELIGKRKSIKGRITKFNNYITSITTEDGGLPAQEYCKLFSQLKGFHKMFADFDDLQCRIEILNGENLDDELEIRDSFETRFHENIACAEILLGTNPQPKPSHSGNEGVRQEHNCSFHNCGDNDVGFRLPIIKIPNFDGTYFKWLNFHDTFESLVHKNEKIKPIHKFHYLCSYLEGEAARVISNLEISDKNYAEAWSLLCKRYNNKRQLITNHLNSLFRIDPMTRESDKSLRFLVDHVTKNLRALQNLGQPTSEWDTLIIHIMTSKLDSSTSLKWEEHRNSLVSSEMPTLDDF
ncbi:hypothetical protein NE865_14954 [Phthorimaea operculella]|nr:hypothetical protein NE865_14954 [Phthorimaea operculella]